MSYQSYITCIGCGKEKKRHLFPAKKRPRLCSACHTKKKEKHKLKRKEYKRANREYLRKKGREYDRRYRKHNKNKLKQKEARYYQENKESILQRGSERRERMPDAYVKYLIEKSSAFKDVPLEDIPQELVEIKRKTVQIKRKVKQLKKEQS